MSHKVRTLFIVLFVQLPHWFPASTRLGDCGLRARPWRVAPAREVHSYIDRRKPSPFFNEPKGKPSRDCSRTRSDVGFPVDVVRRMLGRSDYQSHRRWTTKFDVLRTGRVKGQGKLIAQFFANLSRCIFLCARTFDRASECVDLRQSPLSISLRALHSCHLRTPLYVLQAQNEPSIPTLFRRPAIAGKESLSWDATLVFTLWCRA